MIKVKFKSHTVEGYTGAVLQASTDNGDTWTNVGDLEDGINWYNASGIAGSPGEQALRQVGWSGVYTDFWYEGRQTLDEYVGEKLVQFRIAFGADANSNSHLSGQNPDTTKKSWEGFAFDDIWIGERSRNVMVEQFTNTSSVSANSIMPNFNDFVNENNLDVIDLQFHTGVAGDDLYYSQNPAVSNARALYYGVTQEPYTVMDGNQYKGETQNWIDQTQLLKIRSLQDPQFDIQLTVEKTTNNLQIFSRVIALDSIEKSVISVHIVVIEDIIDNVNALVHESVVKTFLPDASGYNYNQSWAINESKDISAIWEMENVYDPSLLSVVIYIQNDITREIYQAVSLSNGTTKPVGNDEFVSSDRSPVLHVFPNPAESFTAISVENVTIENATLVISNQLGQNIANIEVTNNTTVLSVDDLKPGIYMVRLFEGQNLVATQKLIIR